MKTMNEPKSNEIEAKSYVDRVLEGQRRLGHDATVSPEAYAVAVQRAAEGLAGLTDKSEPPEDAVPA